MSKQFLFGRCTFVHVCRFTLMAFFLLWAVAMKGNPLQSSLVSGVVTSSTDGEPLIGVSVQVKGTSTGSITDINGKYSVNATKGQVLVFSYVGFVTQEIEVGSQSTLNVVLAEDSETLDEVVVIGYGVQKKKLVTGATVQVGGDDILKMNSTSALGALQSQTPGVNITQNNGEPGAGFKVTVRGLGTVGDSSPLYVIDGIAGGDINALNPADIESVDVLKDAASAAIYGARAANGVILVTTKQGKVGKMQASYDGYYGIQNVAKMLPIVNAKEYMAIINEGRFNDGNALYDFSEELPANLYNAIMDGTWNGTNWLEAIRVKNAPIQNHSFNLSGGNEYSRMSLGLSYTTQEGIFGKPTASNYDRYTARINSEHVLLKSKNKDYDVIKISENMNYMYKASSGLGNGGIYWNDIHNMVSANPLLPIYDADGNYYDQADKDADGWKLDPGAANPIANMVYSRGQNLSKSHSLQMNMSLEVQPIKNLKWKSTFGYKMSASSYRSYSDSFNLSSTTVSPNDKVNQNQSVGTNWTWENVLSYSWKVKDLHNFDAVLGQSIEKWGFGESVSVTNATSKFPGSFDHAYISNTGSVSGELTSISGSPWDQGALASFFGRVNYNYAEKYMLTVVMRADGSSNFARGNRWGIFPSVSAGWVMTNEDFMQPLVDKGLDFFKLRGSWGQNGNQNITAFQYLATIAFNNSNSYFFGNDKKTRYEGAYADILANPDVTWETSEQIDLGFDARFLNSRLGVAFDWYKKTTKDWLVQAPVLASYGTGAPYINGGDVVNKGIEVALNWNDNIGRDFTYGVNLNVSWNKNEVTRIANEEGIIHGPSNILVQGMGEMYRAQVGYPIGYFYGYKTAGVFQNQAQVDATAAKLDTAQPGDLIYVDTDKNGVINQDDQTMIGDPHPDVTAGFSLNMGYKGFDFTVTANGAFGQQIAKCGDFWNYTTDIFNRWHGEGTSNTIPRLGGSNQNWYTSSDLFIEDGDYVKITNITLGYDFKKLFRNIPLQQARLYVSVQNAFTFTGYSGMDPEIGYGADTSWVSGIDTGFYPSPRTFLFGVNLKF